jgi:hypothetical protein
MQPKDRNRVPLSSKELFFATQPKQTPLPTVSLEAMALVRSDSTLSRLFGLAPRQKDNLPKTENPYSEDV